MSLKLFHILFIFFCSIAALAFGIWGLMTESANAENQLRLLGGISTVIGLALAAYGIWFARVKSKKLIT